MERLSMTRKFQVAVIVLVVAFCFGQLALAADVPHHWGVKVIKHHPGRNGEARPDTGAAPAAGLYAVGQAFVVTPLQQPGNSGTAAAELWPCAGGAGTAQPDCAFIGSTGTADSASLVGSWVLGSPQYVWYLASDTTDAPDQPFGCAATTSADVGAYCGQTNTWYEDWTGDNTDNLTYLITATQSTTNYLVDSGTVDFGPNVYGGSTPADIDVVIYGDQNFGTEGATGANNGNCSADFNYPMPASQVGVISSITESGTTVTVNFAAGSLGDRVTGDVVLITGAGAAAYEGAVVQLTSATGSPNTKVTFTAPAGLGNVTPAANTAWVIDYEDGSGVYYPKVIQAGKTCKDPVAGAAKLAATTAVSTPKLTKSTSATTCAPAGGAPCYTETFTVKHTLAQSWNLFFR